MPIKEKFDSFKNKFEKKETPAPAEKSDKGNLKSLFTPKTPAEEKRAASAESPAPAIKREEHLPIVKKPVFTPADKTVLAADTVFEGKISAKHDIEIGGKFSGEIASEGNITLRSVTNSNIVANNLQLIDATLTGDVQVAGSVDANDKSVIKGTVNAQDFTCAGQVNGDLYIRGNLTLHATAKVVGNIQASTISITKGAAIAGKLEIKSEAPAEETAY